MLDPTMSVVGSHRAGPDDSVLVLHLPAALDVTATGPVLDEVAGRLPRVPGAGLVADLSAVVLINSMGITCLLQVLEECRVRGVGMVLAAASAGIERFFRQLKLDEKFELAATVDQAVARLSRGGGLGRATGA